MNPRHLPGAVLLVLGTALVAATVALLADRPVGDVFAAVAVAAVGALATGGLGAVLVRRCRSATTRTQALVTAFAPLLVLATGILAAATDGRLDVTDLAPLAVATVAGTTVGVGAALELAKGVGGAAARIAGRLEAIDAGIGSDAGPWPRELVDLEARVLRLRQGLDDQRRRERALEASRRELLAWIALDLQHPDADPTTNDDGRLLSGLADLVELADTGGAVVEAATGRGGGGADGALDAPGAFDVAYRRPATAGSRAVARAPRR